MRPIGTRERWVRCDRLIALRRERELTQATLSALTDSQVSIRTISEAETKGVLTLKTAKAIAGSLGIGVDDLAESAAATSCSDFMRARGWLGAAESAGLVKPGRTGDGFFDTPTGRRFFEHISKRAP